MNLSLLIPASGNIFTQVIEYIREFMTDQPLMFWGMVAALIILICILIISISMHRGKKKEQLQRENQIKKTEPTVFVAVEEEHADINSDILTLTDKIIVSQNELERKIIEQIKNRGPKVLPELTAAYEKAQPEIQQQLAQLVREEKLLERYSHRLTKKDYPQGVLLDAWVCFPDQEALKVFVEMLASHDTNVQMAGVSLLSAMKEPQSMPLLAAALMWPEHFVPARVAEVFAAIGAPGAMLLAYMLPKVADKHKVRVLDTIAYIEAAYPPENVAACLKHENDEIRIAAANALGAGRMPAAAAPLMIAAGDREWRVRAAVAKALGLIGDRRSISVLEALAQDKEGWVAPAAKASLDIFAKI